jgi:predicted GH43/DUF377 family glycosyl hydrolase
MTACLDPTDLYPGCAPKAADVTVNETGVTLSNDRTRVIVRFFETGRDVAGTIANVLTLSATEAIAAERGLLSRFEGRHNDIAGTFAAHADIVLARVAAVDMSAAHKFVLGALFTHEYATEAAALCNPSAVVHPVQDDSGDTAFMMSVRGIGEGHRSSIGFRTGKVTPAGTVTIDPPAPFPAAGQPMQGIHANVAAASELIAALPDVFDDRAAYSVEFPADSDESARVLFPFTPAESHGMEDARFVRFVDDGGAAIYHATYCAFDGAGIAQKLLTTTDFRTFTSTPLTGGAAAGKGLALFPRKVGGRYAALSRADGRSNAVSYSDDMLRWNNGHVLDVEDRIWEFLQLGNCGSPIETDAGWLVITHGVGPMRTYALGAILLDLEDPRTVLARTPTPILWPGTDRCEGGYTPNVVYSCGAFAAGDLLVLPYGICDQTISVATMSIDELLAAMHPNWP